MDTDECLGIDTNECLGNGHGRVFRELTTRQELGLERQSVLILFGIEKVKVTDWGFWA